MECRLSSSTGPWNCQVSIHWEFDEEGKRKEEVFEQAFGPPITNKADVELRLRQAQATVLNPGVKEKDVLKISEGELRNGIKETTPLLFSRNVVCVDLESPGLTDLSFIDLLGMQVCSLSPSTEIALG
jgi:hypothetical protein